MDPDDAEIIFGKPLDPDGLHVAVSLAEWSKADSPVPPYVLSAMAAELMRLAADRQFAAQPVEAPRVVLTRDEITVRVMTAMLDLFAMRERANSCWQATFARKRPSGPNALRSAEGA